MCPQRILADRGRSVGSSTPLGCKQGSFSLCLGGLNLGGDHIHLVHLLTTDLSRTLLHRCSGSVGGGVTQVVLMSLW